jgi:hypothetical protein
MLVATQMKLGLYQAILSQLEMLTRRLLIDLNFQNIEVQKRVIKFRRKYYYSK